MSKIGLKVTLGLLLGAVIAGPARAQQAQRKPSGGKVIAIDILLQPDRTMVDKADAFNTRLRSNDPAGYSLDAEHAPHVTLLQRYIRAEDLDAAAAAVAKVLKTDPPSGLALKASGLDSVMWGGKAVTAIVVERSPDLMRLHQNIIDAVSPFSASSGTAAAFVGAPINAETMAYVKAFVPKFSEENYAPHVTVGVAGEEFVTRLKAEKFEAFGFKAAGIAIYQLGNFGTAAKKLREF